MIFPSESLLYKARFEKNIVGGVIESTKLTKHFERVRDSRCRSYCCALLLYDDAMQIMQDLTL